MCGSMSRQDAPSRPSGSVGLGCTKGAHSQEHVGFEKLLLSILAKLTKGFSETNSTEGSISFFMCQLVMQVVRAR